MLNCIYCGQFYYSNSIIQKAYDERKLIGDFTRNSDIRITKAKPEL